ncbi:hypothetical protein CC77DRAFT_1067667 [Alternaria alternata]|uniref:Uncharacterized protein n=1 Tax=Alternaria alternata TaxID=5599 RepID=A0A177D3M0_ALTAL|nr:hypothetical protein CC77DRAFT_1067667 [Alternaria alternata]OAG13730.1 hypothetical protein CC77DRAFT_1067667 [Alternaria alternata]RYN66795.1 hypothetical protein AA0117_g11703 [Alternaria alternata]
MTDQPTSPSKQGSPRGAMDPPATPGAGRSAKDSTSILIPSPAPAPAPAPSTPGRSDRTLLRSTPRASNSPFPTRAPRTPGGSSLTLCTVDESKYSKVTVHTAKCTECDKRNMDTMRRCPGCTFQVCQPCYEKRLKQDKGLLHGNMATPSAAGGGLSASGGSRAVRKKPLPSTEEIGDKIENEEGPSHMKIETTPAMPKSSAKKRAIKKKAPLDETEESSEDEFEPDDTSPTPSKRRRTGRRRSELTFAESALATALRTPPATRATRKSLPAPTHRAPSFPASDPGNAGTSVGYGPSGFLSSDFMGDKDLYNAGIKPYKDQPLLARREPVNSNPANRIPDIIKRGGKPRPSNQTYHNIQKSLRAKLQQNQVHETDQDEIVAHTAGQSKAEQNADPQTVAAFVEKEAARYQNETMDEDENEAILSAMKSAALVWSKQTYKKLDSDTQLAVQPGLKLRLDLIDKMFREELARLMGEHADRIISELGISVEKPVAVPPGQLFKPA